MDRVNDLLATKLRASNHSPCDSDAQASEHTQRVETLRSIVLNRRSVGLKKLTRSQTCGVQNDTSATLQAKLSLLRHSNGRLALDKNESRMSIRSSNSQIGLQSRSKARF